MIERIAIVRNPAGIHCRPSAVIIKAASQFDGDIRVFAESGEADLHSMLELVSLGLETGSQVRIRVSGVDEDTVCAKLVDLFETEFGFEALGAGSRYRTIEEVFNDL